MSWCHDYQSLLILPCYLHIMVPRQSVTTDTAVLSTHHDVTTISHSWYHRDIHTSRCHDHQPLLMRSCYLHVMVPRLSVTTDTAVLSTYHGATTISPYWYYRATHTPWCHDYQLQLVHRAIHTSRCHDYQSPLKRPFYLHGMAPRPSVTTGTAVLPTYHGATTISPY